MATRMEWARWKETAKRRLPKLMAIRPGRRIFKVMIACFVLTSVHVFFLYTLFSSPPTVLTAPPKIILWYYPPRYIPNFDGLVPLEACPSRNCFMTRNRTYLSKSDAVIFSAEHISENTLPPRTKDQVWVFHNNEPPYHFAVGRPFHTPPWSSAFNWTMDFRFDADIVRPYAKLRKRETIVQKNYADIVNGKTKLVAIMVSNCENWSGRLPYAHELNKTIPVDVYGKCGQDVYPREKHNEWLQFLNKSYKFYLAFENLYCLDYISEKFFNNFNLDLVIVGRGGGNYSRDVPRGTYINAADFKTPEELGNYLLYLHTNPAEYIRILKEKDNFFFENEEYRYIDSIQQNYREHYYEKQPLCDLCDKLRDIKANSKTIPDIVPWFRKGVCQKRDI